MALSFSASKANIARRYYKVYMRETTTTITSADYDTLVHWNTFLATHTYIGYCENKNTKLSVSPSDPIEIDEGEEYNIGKEANFEAKFVQSAVADDTALADMAGKDCDLLLVSATSLKFAFIHNKRFSIDEQLISGEIESTIIRHKQNVTAATNYRTKGAIPTV